MTTRLGIPAATTAENPTGPVKTGSLWAGKRLYVAILLFFNLFINYMDRINLFIAAPAHIWGSEESVEGMNAFLEKRKPNFQKFRLQNKKLVDSYLAGIAADENKALAK